ncbi:MAG: carboxynorspermidine decarboxylase [Planctomycetota bacterium]|nr:MAG: carboxynorspermidine decarboxylase [Planctomycetota bacterium]
MDGKNSLIEQLRDIDTPSYVVSEELLKKNLKILKHVQDESGCKIILALKGFAMHSLFPIIKEYLPGTTASSLNEARLGHEKFGGEVHVYAPAYQEKEFAEYLELASHVTFNSFSQWKRFRNKFNGHNVECGIRINPEFSEIEFPLYNPCYKNSRLGVTLAEFDDENFDGISGLHFHTHCASNSNALQKTLKVVEEKFQSVLEKVTWVNFGGGHHITRDDYDLDLLIKLIVDFKAKYNVEVVMEPGEAVALNTGYIVTSVVDIIRNDMDIAMLDTSAAAHMPDVMEMPYRPKIIDGFEPLDKKYTYRLGGLTCLAGDVVGDYSFNSPLKIGDKLILLDMAHYSMVKNNTFNGVELPSICILRENGNVEVVKKFGYDDYKDRLS